MGKSISINPKSSIQMKSRLWRNTKPQIVTVRANIKPGPTASQSNIILTPRTVYHVCYLIHVWLSKSRVTQLDKRQEKKHTHTHTP